MEKILINKDDRYVEICELPEEELAGRVKIKMSALKIQVDNTEWNSNGITWLEEYVESNIKSIIGSPYVVSWLDEENQVPSNHGLMSYDDEGNLIFDGVAVGSIQDAYIDTVDIDGTPTKVLMTEGYIFKQRYYKFVDWLKGEMEDDRVYGSIEINGKGKSRVIEYLDGDKNEDGSKKMGRIPTQFDFTALAILYINDPADKNSIVFEVNTKEETQKGGQELMEELNVKITELSTQVTELNAKVTELNSANVEKDEKIAELNEALVSANKSLEEVNAKCAELDAECSKYKEEKEKLEDEKKKAEVNSYFEEEIPKNKFEEEEINSLKDFVEKCDLQGLKNAESELIVKKFKEKRKNDIVDAEVNSKKEDDIYFSTKEEKIDDLESAKELF